MNNLKIIQESMDYIEENLKTELNAKELAEMAGFSIFYYYRLFQEAVGMPLMQYIVRRKLLNAIYEIGQGKKMIDVALSYGFDTHAGFYKAFKREIGYTPSIFLQNHKVKRPYKINLFQEEYIIMTHKKISKILENWGLQNEAIKDVFYEGTGNHNDNAYYIGEHYILKFSANLGKVKNHIILSRELEHVGLISATSIQTLDRRDYMYDGEMYFYVTKRLEGSQILAESIYEKDSISKARFIGEMIGQLHIALSRVEVVVHNVDLYQNVINWAIPKTKEVIEFKNEMYDNYVKTFGNLYEQLPKQIIHRDPNPGNIIVKDHKWGFIDFELSEKNVRIFDPCYAATGILSESFSENNKSKLSEWIEIYKHIMYGYDSVVKLSNQEKEAVPYVLLSIQLIFLAWLSEQEKYEDNYKTNIKMTKWIIDYFEQLKF